MTTRLKNDKGMRERVTGDGGEVFPPTADGVIRWAETTRPRPSRADVIAHARSTLPRPQLGRLARLGYPELS